MSRSQSIASTLLDRVFRLERIEVDHAAARHRADRDEVNENRSFSFGSRMTSETVGVVEAEIGQLERGASQGNVPRLVEHLIGQRRRRVLEHGEALHRHLVRDDFRPRP